MQVNIHEAKSQLSKLIEAVEQGEKVTIARHGKPVAELVPVRSSRFPLGAGRGDPLGLSGNDWWQPMTNQEADDWLEGK